MGRFKLSGNFVKCNICRDPLNLISSRLIAGNVFKNAVDIAKKISNGFETLVFFEQLPSCLIVAVVFDSRCYTEPFPLSKFPQVWEHYRVQESE